MSTQHRIEFLKIKGNYAKVRVCAIHPDATKLPISHFFLLQALISYWDYLRLGYSFCFENLPLSKDEMKIAAETCAKKEDFAQWYVLMHGAEIEITKEEYDAIDISDYGHNPPAEVFERTDKARAELEKKLGNSITVVSAKRENDDAPTIYSVTLRPNHQQLREIAKQVIVSINYLKSREFKSYSKSTRSYAVETAEFKVSDAAYLLHLCKDVAVETALYV